MIDLYMSTTPNGLKAALFVEEAGVAHRKIMLRLSKGEQFAPDFLAVSPNAKIPAIVDHAPADGGAPLSVFESGAIMLYLAEKHGVLLPASVRERTEVLQWLFWQVGGLGPFAGQAGFFRVYAGERVPFAIERYTREVTRLFGVLDKRLEGRDYIAGAFSIADIACYPWTVSHEGFGQNITAFPNLHVWFERMRARPATQRVYDGVEDVYSVQKHFSAEERAVLYGGKAGEAS
ncbi:glutathione binding-like protein [Terricaulis sp.]|uniref:glutathione binding-like protein n=1 Tax=Terricaulis sp. TaxID=2768686 RepID=UPI0037845A92